MLDTPVFVFSFLNDRNSVTFLKVVIQSTFLCFFSGTSLLYKTHFRKLLEVVIARTLEFSEQLHCYLRHSAIVNPDILRLLFAAQYTL